MTNLDLTSAGRAGRSGCLTADHMRTEVVLDSLEWTIRRMSRQPSQDAMSPAERRGMWFITEAAVLALLSATDSADGAHNR